MENDQLVGGLWCHEVLELLPEVLEGALTPERSSQVTAHLSACDRCARFGGAYQAMVQALRPRDPPERFDPARWTP